MGLVSIPAPMLCIGGEEKQKDIKKGNELPFLISFSFPGDLRSLAPNCIWGGNARSLAAPNYAHPYSKFSGGGAGEASLRKRGSTEKALDGKTPTLGASY